MHRLRGGIAVLVGVIQRYRDIVIDVRRVAIDLGNLQAVTSIVNIRSTRQQGQCADFDTDPANHHNVFRDFQHRTGGQYRRIVGAVDLNHAQGLDGLGTLRVLDCVAKGSRRHAVIGNTLKLVDFGLTRGCQRVAAIGGDG